MTTVLILQQGGLYYVGYHTTTDQQRYQEMAERYAAIEEHQLTCAMHVHVEIESADEGVVVLDGIAPWLPVLIALSATLLAKEPQGSNAVLTREAPLWTPRGLYDGIAGPFIAFFKAHGATAFWMLLAI